MDLQQFEIDELSNDNSKKEEGEVNESPYVKLSNTIIHYLSLIDIIEEKAMVEQFPKFLTNK